MKKMFKYISIILVLLITISGISVYFSYYHGRKREYLNDVVSIRIPKSWIVTTSSEGQIFIADKALSDYEINSSEKSDCIIYFQSKPEYTNYDNLELVDSWGKIFSSTDVYLDEDTYKIQSGDIIIQTELSIGYQAANYSHEEISERKFIVLYTTNVSRDELIKIAKSCRREAQE